MSSENKILHCSSWSMDGVLEPTYLEFFVNERVVSICRRRDTQNHATSKFLLVHSAYSTCN